jgi:hypothetical protein
VQPFTRMNQPMAYEVASNQQRTLLMPYGDTWRRERKVMHQILNVNKSPIFEPLQDIKSKALLFNYLKNPYRCFQAHGAFSSSVIMSMVFGRRAKPDDKNMVLSQALTREFLKFMRPGNSIVDIFPFLARIPWLKSLQPWRWYADDLYVQTRR